MSGPQGVAGCGCLGIRAGSLVAGPNQARRKSVANPIWLSSGWAVCGKKNPVRTFSKSVVPPRPGPAVIAHRALLAVSRGRSRPSPSSALHRQHRRFHIGHSTQHKRTWPPFPHPPGGVACRCGGLRKDCCARRHTVAWAWVTITGRRGVAVPCESPSGHRWGARADEWNGFENRRARQGTVGSNPTPTAFLRRNQPPRKTRCEAEVHGSR